MIELLTTLPETPTSKKSRYLPEVVNNITALLECSDYNLAHPTEQPKLDIAHYVTSEIEKNPEKFENTKVPVLFKSQNEAKTSGEKYMARSEHSQDYDGISGLLSSFLIEVGDTFNEEEYKEELRQGGHRMLNDYCKHYDVDIHNFIDGLSFSYWEYIEGSNIMIVRDEAIEGKYHIFLNDVYAHYMCYDSGNITQGKVPENIGNIEKLIQQYEGISSLPKFDELQCPNIEFQLGSDQNTYFLQYKRGHQKVLDNWVLDRKLEKGEVEADIVRGVTPPCGIECKITGNNIYIPYDTRSVFSMENNYQYPHKLVLRTSKGNDIGGAFHGIVAHIVQSGVYIVVPEITLFNEIYEIMGTVITGVNVRVISDGKRAIVKFPTYEEVISDALEGYKDNEGRISDKDKRRLLIRIKPKKYRSNKWISTYAREHIVKIQNGGEMKVICTFDENDNFSMYDEKNNRLIYDEDDNLVIYDV